MWARLVQLRFSGKYTSEGYVAGQAWRDASLPACPLHGGRTCGLARHGSYPRVSPPGTRVARYRCATARVTFSLLPDFLASRLSGTLDAVEGVVAATETARSVEAAADVLRPDIELPGAVRWVRRRLSPVHAALVVIATLMPSRLPATLTVGAVRAHLGTEHALMELRSLAEGHLGRIRWPLGLRPPGDGGTPPRGGPAHTKRGLTRPAETGTLSARPSTRPREVP